MGLLFKLLGIVSCLIGSSSFTEPVIKRTKEDTLDLLARSAVLVECESGQVLYEKDARVRLYPASMTKMMGLILVLEKIDEGKLSWNDDVTVSETAKSMGGTQIYLAPGETMKLIDLFKSVAINSANDAIVALGEKASGSLPAFINDMNEKAKELKMEDTHFNNATGFDDPDHYTSALDMAKCGLELVKHGEDILRFTRMKEGYVREDTANPFWLVNTNKMLGSYLGMDGLKTGYTNLAGYNLTATASRDGVRLLSVVMKEESIKNRAKDTATLLDYGFSKVSKVELYKAASVLGTYQFKKTLAKPIEIYIDRDVSPIADKGTTIDDYTAYVQIEKDTAPIAAKEEIGKLVVTNTKTGVVTKYPVYVKEEVAKYSFFDYWLHNIGELLA